MELKLRNARRLRVLSWSFNRTSMELKPAQKVRIRGAEGLLLIEPVWNWNRRCYTAASRAIGLLIEPVWNWNPAVKNQPSSSEQLLIEPVWNWNGGTDNVFNFSLTAFNRTSMELKPWTPVATAIRIGLLIEPVWNWNVGFVCVTHPLTHVF